MGDGQTERSSILTITRTTWIRAQLFPLATMIVKPLHHLLGKAKAVIFAPSACRHVFGKGIE